MTKPILSEAFKERISGTFGLSGEKWLKALPIILEEVSANWSLALEPPFDDLSYNFVAPATRADGDRVVLKIGVPHPELETEIKALTAYRGRGAVRVLAAQRPTPERPAGALLLERLEPGRPILELDDEEATQIATQVMRQLHGAPVPGEGFRTIQDWGQGLARLRAAFKGGTGPFPVRLVARAEANLRDLLESSSGRVLLHADLHHWNILSAQRQPWLAIDPKGILGEPEYETGAWLRNPFPELLGWPNVRGVIRRRVDQFAAELAFDRERIYAWGIYQAVLAAWWSYESNDPNWRQWLDVAGLIAEANRRLPSE